METTEFLSLEDKVKLASSLKEVNPCIKEFIMNEFSRLEFIIRERESALSAAEKRNAVFSPLKPNLKTLYDNYGR